ncbi:MAG: peptidase M28 family protein, partial [bacterium]
MLRNILIKVITIYYLLCIFISNSAFAQNSTNDSTRQYLNVAIKIIETALAQGKAYSMLAELTQDIGPRLNGSPEAAAAVEWGRQTMLKYGLENVHLQEVMVPHWVRGPVEEAAIINSPTVGIVPLTVCALGGSIGTPELGVVGEVIEVHNFEEVQKLGSKAQGKIIFYNRPMDSRK